MRFHTVRLKPWKNPWLVAVRPPQANAWKSKKAGHQNQGFLDQRQDSIRFWKDWITRIFHLPLANASATCFFWRHWLVSSTMWKYVSETMPRLIVAVALLAGKNARCGWRNFDLCASCRKSFGTHIIPSFVDLPHSGSPKGHHFLVRLVSEFRHYFSRGWFIIQKETAFFKWWLISRERYTPEN